MSYTGPTARDQWLNWPAYPNSKTWNKSQQIYKTTPGTKRSETPYTGDVSFYKSYTRQGPGAWSPTTCNLRTAATIYGRNRDDLWGLQGRADNRARTLFLERLKESKSASLGAAIAQWDKSLEMITRRSSQILNIARAIRSRNPKRIKRALVGNPIPPGRKNQNGWAETFLEYSFGWAPLLGDIHTSCEVLSEPYPGNGKVKATGVARLELPNMTVMSSQAFQQWRMKGKFQALTTLRGRGVLSNPNLGVFERLGLVNPAAVAWEVVPFSFVIDYFVDIGGYLNSLSDTAGWTITELGTTRFRSATGDQYHDSADNGNAWNYTNHTLESGYGCYFMSRTVGGMLPRWSTSFENPLNGLSLQRAATSVALLVTFLKS